MNVATAAEYPYWIGGTDTVYVPVDVAGNSNQTIYIIKTAGYAPNANDVFEYYENFDSYTAGSSITSVAGWSLDSGSAFISNDAAKSGSNSLRVTGINVPNNGQARYTFPTPINKNVVVEVQSRTNKPFNNQWGYNIITMGGNSEIQRMVYNRNNEAGYGDTISHTNHYLAGGTVYHKPYHINTFEKLSTDLSLSTSKANFYVNDVSKASNVNFVNSNSELKYLHFNSYMASGTYYLWIDDIIVRQYVATTPTVTVTDMGTYYKIDIQNNEASALSGYQIHIPADQLNIESSTDSLKISDINPEQDPDPDPVPTALWRATKYTGAVPFTVQFVDQSSNADSVGWDFAGLGTSSLSNPTFTFNEPGIYTVILTATNEYGSDTFSRDITAYVPVEREGSDFIGRFADSGWLIIIVVFVAFGFILGEGLGKQWVVIFGLIGLFAGLYMKIAPDGQVLLAIFAVLLAIAAYRKYKER